MEKIVGVAGRFQPFHWGHYEYIMAATKISKNILIGLTNPDLNSIYTHKTNPERSKPDSNPFSFDERCEMIGTTLDFLSPHINYKFRRCEFGNPQSLRNSLGEVDFIAITVYDDWSKHRAELFRQAGYNIVVLWERDEKITSGSEIRSRIRSNLAWKHLVPFGTIDVIESIVYKRSI